MSVELPPGANPDAVRRMTATFHENQVAIDNHWDDFVAHHEGEWVASHAGGFAFGATIGETLGKATALGWPMNVTALRIVRAQRPYVLL